MAAVEMVVLIITLRIIINGNSSDNSHHGHHNSVDGDDRSNFGVNDSDGDGSDVDSQ